MKQFLKDLVDLIFGFRKFIAFIAILLVSIIFRLCSKIDGGQFVDLMKAVTVSFFASNSVEHFTAMAKDYFNNKGNSNASDQS